MITRTVTPEDGPAITAIHLAAFGGDEEARLVDLLRMGPSFVPELSIVAEEKGDVIGHALFSRAKIVGEAASMDILVLGPVGVLPDIQRNGIGTGLMEEGLRRAREMGFAAVGLIGHPDFYVRFGFRPGSFFGVKTTYDVPDDVFMVLELTSGVLADVRGTLVYPQEFDNL